MTTLESSFLQRNVPGRYSSWSEEQEDAHGRSEEDCGAPQCCGHQADDVDEDEDKDAAAGYYETYKHDERDSSNSGGFRTGPKGVLADYKANQRVAQQHQAQEVAHRQRVLWRIARGDSTSRSDSDDTSTLPTIAEEEAEEEEDEEGEDAAFWRAYRAQRLQLLKQQHAAGHDGPCLRPVFGEAEEVSGSGMVDVIESLRQRSPTTTVVVHVHEPHVPSCRLVNAFWPALADKHPTVRFLRLHQGCNLPTHDLRLDTAVLPMLLVYRNGELADCLARLDASLGASFLCEDLDEWLGDQGVWGAGE